MKPARIVIADDHELVRKGLAAVIHEVATWKVVAEAANGRQAVEQVAAHKPDIAIMDLTMPELNGLEATRQILAAEPQTRVLILTAHESEQLIREVLGAGAQGYVLKSDAGRTLVSAVDALLEGGTFFTSKVARMVLEGYLRNPNETRGHSDTCPLASGRSCSCSRKGAATRKWPASSRSASRPLKRTAAISCARCSSTHCRTSCATRSVTKSSTFSHRSAWTRRDPGRRPRACGRPGAATGFPWWRYQFLAMPSPGLRHYLGRMGDVVVDAWLALLAGLIAIAVSYTLIELVKRLAGPARPRARFCRVAGGAVAVGVGLWGSNTIAALAAVQALHWSSFRFAQIFLPLPVALLGPAAVLTLLSGGQASARSHRQCGDRRGRRPACRLSRHRLAAIGRQRVLWIGSGTRRVARVCSACLDGGALAARQVPRLPLDVCRCSASAATLAGAGAIIGMQGLALKDGHLVFGAFCGIGPSGNVQLFSVALAAFASAVLAVTHVITVYGGKLELRSKRYAREIEEVHSRLHYLATHDSSRDFPTGFCSRSDWPRRSATTARPGRAIAVAVLDLDRFSAVNHTLGHGAGDWLLTEVASRLGAVLRPEDTLARLGSDEFVFFIDSVAARFEAETVTARVLAALKDPIMVNGAEVHIRPSIGVSVWPDDGPRVDDLLAHAEAAMSVVKRIAATKCGSSSAE